VGKYTSRCVTAIATSAGRTAATKSTVAGNDGMEVKSTVDECRSSGAEYGPAGRASAIAARSAAYAGAPRACDGRIQPEAAVDRGEGIEIGDCPTARHSSRGSVEENSYRKPIATRAPARLIPGKGAVVDG